VFTQHQSIIEYEKLRRLPNAGRTEASMAHALDLALVLQ